MTNSELRIKITRRAQRDIRNIGFYTIETWGFEQAVKYQREIDGTLERLRINPKLGRQRPEIDGDVLSFKVNRHIILYRVSRNTLEILRILHARADVERAFNDE